MGGGGRSSFLMRPKISKPRQKSAREGGVEGDGHCHCRRWQWIDLSCRGRCRRVRLKSLLYHVQTHNKQIHNNQLVLSGYRRYTACASPQEYSMPSPAYSHGFLLLSVFFFHDENAIYPKGPIDRVVRSESITHFR